MNRQDIIAMAREAGEAEGMAEFVFHPVIEAFAALVASAEREACAEVGKYALPNHSDLGLVVEAAIRARGYKHD